MARAAAVVCLLLALAAAASAAGTHSPAPAPAVDCISAAAGLSDCLSYVSPGSTEKTPSKTCCGEVKTAVANPAVVDCLCQLATSKNLGLPIDMKRVLALPPACGLSNTVFSKCHLSAGPPTEGVTQQRTDHMSTKLSCLSTRRSAWIVHRGITERRRDRVSTESRGEPSDDGVRPRGRRGRSASRLLPLLS
ncbi:unnamed protein product [Urochloa humidicola]